MKCVCVCERDRERAREREREINPAQHTCPFVSREVVKSHSAPFDPRAIWPPV